MVSLLEDGVIKRGNRAGGRNRTMRDEEGEFVEGVLNVLEQVRGNTAQMIVPKAIEGTKERGNDWQRVPLRGGEGSS